jgi:cytochrome c oxidase accessory protein FixG
MAFIKDELIVEDGADVSIQLFSDHEKVYARSVTGEFRRLKWLALWVLLGIYHVVPWLRWDRGPEAPDQAILMDLAGRHAYILGVEIWPQEIYYLVGLMLLAAVGLFLATALLGRVWCGFACPQTVWTDLYTWVEWKVEGDRNKRLKLDRGPLTLDKAMRKALKHGIWLIIAFFMSFAWVWYFNDAPTVTRDVFAGTAGPWVYAFVAMLTGSTYLLAGWAREQVCIYMCPWSRFQGAMFDEDSLIVTYAGWRGEPRGKARRGQDFAKRGHCIDCTLCVQVCPTGVDIREGDNMACIGCALCIDACDTVMDRFSLPHGLIAYDSANNQTARSAGKPPRARPLRPRTLIYGAIMLAIAGIMAFGLVNRASMDVTVLRDRAPLFVTLSDGRIRNGYTFKVVNMERRAKTHTLRAEGIEGATLNVIGVEAADATEVALPIRADAVATFRVLVKAGKGVLSGKSTVMTFVLHDGETGHAVRHETVFAGPGR